MHICGFIRFQISEDGTKIKDVQETISSKWDQGPPVPDPLMHPLHHPYTLHDTSPHPHPLTYSPPCDDFLTLFALKRLKTFRCGFQYLNIIDDFTLNKSRGPLISTFSFF